MEITYFMPPLVGKEPRPGFRQMATSRRTTAAVIWPNQQTPNRANNSIKARKCRIRVLCANAGSPLAVPVPPRYSYSERSTLRLNQQQGLAFPSSPLRSDRGNSETHITDTYLPRRASSSIFAPHFGRPQNRDFILLHAFSALQCDPGCAVRTVASPGLAAGILPLLLHSPPVLGVPVP
jgi:rRNA maturation protein Nop10